MADLRRLLQILEETNDKIHKNFGEDHYMTARFERMLDETWTVDAESLHWGERIGVEWNYSADRVRHKDGKWPVRRAEGLALVLVEDCFGGDSFFCVLDESKEVKS